MIVTAMMSTITTATTPPMTATMLSDVELAGAASVGRVVIGPVLGPTSAACSIIVQTILNVLLYDDQL